MAMKGCSAFPKAPASLEHHHQIVKCRIRTLVGEGSNPSAEVQSVYSTAPVDWKTSHLINWQSCIQTPRRTMNDTQFQSLRWRQRTDHLNYSNCLKKIKKLKHFFTRKERTVDAGSEVGWLVCVLWHINLCRLFNAKCRICKRIVCW